MNLRANRDKRKGFYQRLATQVINFPSVIDSRGRILRPPRMPRRHLTDPGWTPIFTSAAAVVLEIGGALQHGAVVARELGLPCVAGIEGVTTAIRDGQLIEVDGYLGTVRLIPT